MRLDLAREKRRMKTFRILVWLAIAITGPVLAPPALAHDGIHDWKLSEILGWYRAFSGSAGLELELLVEQGTMSEFNLKKSTRIKWRGQFEKLNRNRFILFSNEIIDEKGINQSNNKDWCNILSLEMSEPYRHRPGERAVLRLSFFWSEADARANENRCGGSSYLPIARRWKNP